MKRGSALPILYALEPTHWWTRGMCACTQALLMAAGWDGAGDVLDIGCGGGMTLAATPAKTRVGIDISWQAAQQTATRSALSARASATALPFAHAQFDLLLALDSLDQWQVDMPHALAACAATLRPGGLLLLRVGAYAWLYGAHDIATGAGHRTSPNELARAVQQAGLSVERTTFANTLLFPLEAGHRLARRTATQHDLGQPPRWLNQLLQRALELEAAWLRRGGNFSYGLSIFCLARRV